MDIDHILNNGATTKFLVIGSTHLDTYAQYDPNACDPAGETPRMLTARDTTGENSGAPKGSDPTRENADTLAGDGTEKEKSGAPKACDCTSEKQGILYYTVGGGAFNIAANLAAPEDREYDVSLFTYIQPDSLSAGLIRDELIRRKINGRHLCKFEFASQSESGYVAQLAGSHVESAVWHDEMYDVGVPTDDLKRLHKAIRAHTAIITDSSISSAYLDEKINAGFMVEIIRDIVENKDLYLSFETEQKMCDFFERLKPQLDANQSPSRKFCKIAFIYTPKHVEGDSAPKRDFSLKQINKYAGTVRNFCHYICVIHEKGYLVYDLDSRITESGAAAPGSTSENKNPRSFSYPDYERGTVGRWAWDAVVAAICSYYSLNNKDGRVEWEKCDSDVKQFVKRIPIDRIQAYPLAPRVDVEAIKIRQKRGLACRVLAGALAVAIVGTLVGAWATGLYSFWTLVLFMMFFLVPSCAGVAGGMARIIWGLVSTTNPEQLTEEYHRTLSTSGTLGFLAGLIASLIAFIPMLTNTPQPQPNASPSAPNAMQAAPAAPQPSPNTPRAAFINPQLLSVATPQTGEGGKAQAGSGKEPSSAGKAQISGASLPNISVMTLIYEILIGLVAGFTMDAVFKRISIMEATTIPH